MMHRSSFAIALALTTWMGAATARADDPLGTALATLKTAQTQLNAAPDDKTGHRGKALDHLKQAITEVEAAVAAAKGGKTTTPPADSGPIAASKDPKAEKLFKANCASCHGADGKGQTAMGKKQGTPDMTAAAWHTEWTDAKMIETIQKGIKREKDGKHQEMPVFAKKLTLDQIKSLIGFVRTFKK